MLSLLTNTKSTTLVFPDEQRLWTFFANAEVSEFRIESSKNAISGKFHQSTIELAKQKFGADEIKEEFLAGNYAKYLSNTVMFFAQLCTMRKAYQ